MKDQNINHNILEIISLPGDRLILLCNPPGVHVVPAPLLRQLLRNHRVDTLLKAAVILPQGLNVDHWIDHGTLVHLKKQELQRESSHRCTRSPF